MPAIIGVGVHRGTGKRAGDLDFTLIAKLIVAQNCVWAITVGTTKASILTQYLRFLNNRKARIACYVLLASLLPAVAWGVFGGIFLCSPTGRLWDKKIPGHCRDAKTYWISVATVDILLDFLVLFLPVPFIAGLHLPRRQRYATMLVFLLGFFVCAVSVVRVGTVIGVADQNVIMSGVWSIIWSVTEANVGIICASLLALRALIVKVFPKLLEEPEPAKHSMRLPMHGVRLPMIGSSKMMFYSTDSEKPIRGIERRMSVALTRSPSSVMQGRTQPSLGPPRGERKLASVQQASKNSGVVGIDIAEVITEDKKPYK